MSTAGVIAALADLAATDGRAPVVLVPRDRPRGPGSRYPGASGWDALAAADLWARAQAVAAGLHRLGLRRGDRVILLVPPGADFFCLAFAALSGGLVPVLVDPGVGRRALTSVLDEADAAAFVGSPRAHAARTALRLAPGARIAVLADAPRRAARVPGIDAHIGDLADAAAAGSHDVRPVDAGQTAAILFTSGSTGPPKGVEYTHEIMTAQVEALRGLYDLGPGDVNVATFPPFALFGPALGMTTVVPRMDATRPADVHPPDVLDAVDLFGATTLFGSPALLDAVTAWAASHGRRLGGLRLVQSAGAPVARRIVAATVALLDRDARMVTPYGATEALPVTSVDHTVLLGGPDRAVGDEVDGHPDYGVCVGPPAPGVRVVIVPLDRAGDPAGGEPAALGVGEVGEIVVAGPQVARSYFRRPDATRRAMVRLDGEPARRMGDVGWLDTAGRLWVCGRVAHLVDTPHGPLPPVAVEVLVDGIAGVRRSALVRGPDGRPGVAVEVDAAGDRLEVLARVRDLLIRHPRGRDVGHVAAHPGLPVDPRHNAKIDRPAVAAWWAAR